MATYKITPNADFTTGYPSRIFVSLNGRQIGTVRESDKAVNVYGHYTGQTWGEALLSGLMDVDGYGAIVAWTPNTNCTR